MAWTTFFNPFEKYSEKTLLAFGLGATFLGSFLGYLMKARFDGIIDMHIVENINWNETLIDNVINVLVLFVLFFVFGKVINSKTRAIDILNVSLVCRIPIYLISLTNVGGYLDRATHNILDKIDFENLQNPPEFQIMDLVMMMVFSVLSIIFLIWMILLFWNGFKTSTNSKGVKNVIIFIMLFIVAEVLSKYLIGIFNF